jgi:hypothetical protein
MVDFNFDLDFNCSYCDHTFKKNINRIHISTNVKCPNCNEAIPIDSREFVNKIKKMREQINRFPKDSNFKF